MKARHPSMGRTSLLLAGMGAALLLAGCDSHEKKPVDEASDPALAGGLGDRIVVDPEMTGGRNPAPAASGNGIVLPAAARSPEAVAAAKKAAAEAAGGALGAAPATQKGSASPLAEGAASAARVTQASRARRPTARARSAIPTAGPRSCPPRFRSIPAARCRKRPEPTRKAAPCGWSTTAPPSAPQT
ncbi:hypothetical protein [Novosphingobium sp. ST904]|uniref:hypothetical protein n=1 Tax=Novosphingobium sp. ST904 TaxID=1684385 RepID=UPI001E5A55C7|nr:hypothetical protein [Novosphingobium sp. ST904]